MAYQQSCPSYTAQKIKFSIKDFFSKYDQVRRKLRIWSHLMKKSLIENFIFCAELFELNISYLCAYYICYFYSKKCKKIRESFVGQNYLFSLKVHYCRFENLPICSCSYKNNTLQI